MLGYDGPRDKTGQRKRQRIYMYIDRDHNNNNSRSNNNPTFRWLYKVCWAMFFVLFFFTFLSILSCYDVTRRIAHQSTLDIQRLAGPRTLGHISRDMMWHMAGYCSHDSFKPISQLLFFFLSPLSQMKQNQNGWKSATGERERDGLGDKRAADFSL